MTLLFLALLLSTAIHLLAIAGVGKAMGVTLREISIGSGPTLLRVGRFRVALLPINGFVRFKDSSVEFVEREHMGDALDGQSTGRQLVIALSGCATLLVISFALLGGAAFEAVAAGAVQILAGAISPLGEAQQLLAHAADFLRSASIASLMGVVAAKLTAWNLLPFLSTNGAAALAMLGRHFHLDRWWPEKATQVLGFVTVAVFLSWLLALIVYVFSGRT